MSRSQNGGLEVKTGLSIQIGSNGVIDDVEYTLKYVDVVKIQPLQAGLDAIKDVLPAEASLVDIAVCLCFRDAEINLFRRGTSTDEEELR